MAKRDLLGEWLDTEEPDVSEKSKKSHPKNKKIKSVKENLKDVSKKQEKQKSDDEENLDAIDIEEFQKDQQKIKRSKRQHIIVETILCIACIYLIFLIYGVFVTDYDYNQKGQVTPQVLTVSEIKNEKELQTIIGYYYQARSLYEKTLLLDYRLGEGEEDPLDLAPEYNALLDTSSKIIVQLKALEPSKINYQTYQLLLKWVQTDISVYLQDISAAISQNDSNKASDAVKYKDISYTDFKNLTSNIISLGKKTKGIDVSKIADWSPEKYLKEATGK